MIAREIKDPRVLPVTLTSVTVAPDGSFATVLVALFGRSGEESPSERKEMAACLKGLNSSVPYLRKHLAKVLSIRHIPELVFREDRGLINVGRVNELLKQISDEPPVPPLDPPLKSISESESAATR